MKQIIIFGATGGTGKELVEQALNSGYKTTAFVRNPDKLLVKSSNLEIRPGDVLNYTDVKSAIENHKAVYCCLGAPASDKSGLREKGVRNIVKAMEETSTNRLICQSSLGFADSREVLPWYMKYIIVPLVLKNAFADHENQEKVIKESNLNWTIVRPANLTDGQLTEKYKYGFSNAERIKLKISRADVAHFMLNQLEEKSYIREKVGISY
ncbi:MAG: SDR family oxidoreductase [Bacteroidota bacterium]